MAPGHPRPDVRCLELCRACESFPGGRLDLPVVETPVEQDAGLVHRLDLLLGRRLDHHGGGRDGPAGPLERSSASSWPTRDRSPCLNNLVVRRPSSRLISTTIINAFGVRLLSIINNIGVAAEILGHARVRPDPAVLRNHQRPAVLFDTAGMETGPAAATCRSSGRDVHGAVRRLRVRHCRDLRRGDARREPPGAARHPVARSGCRASSARSSCWRSSCRSRTCRGDRRRPGTRVPDRRHAQATNVRPRRTRSASVYLFVILIAVYVCTLAIQGATTRLMFSMGRDRRLPLGSLWGHVNQTFRTPANAAVAVGVLAAIPFFSTGQPAASSRRRDRADLPQLLPVQPRRPRRRTAAGRTRAPGSSSAAGARSSTSSPSI